MEHARLRALIQIRRNYSRVESEAYVEMEHARLRALILAFVKPLLVDQIGRNGARPTKGIDTKRTVTPFSVSNESRNGARPTKGKDGNKNNPEYQSGIRGYFLFSRMSEEE